MKNARKLAIFITQLGRTAAVCSVAFFVTAVAAFAQTSPPQWEPPTDNPPEGNRPGYIYNYTDSEVGTVAAQGANLKIGGSATAGEFCLGADCITAWPTGSGTGTNFWTLHPLGGMIVPTNVGSNIFEIRDAGNLHVSAGSRFDTSLSIGTTLFVNELNPEQTVDKAKIYTAARASAADKYGVYGYYQRSGFGLSPKGNAGVFGVANSYASNDFGVYGHYTGAGAGAGVYGVYQADAGATGYGVRGEYVGNGVGYGLYSQLPSTAIAGSAAVYGRTGAAGQFAGYFVGPSYIGMGAAAQNVNLLTLDNPLTGNGTSASLSYKLGGTTHGNIRSYYNSGGFLGFRSTGSVDQVTIDPAGNVGIGDPTPDGLRLDVEGKLGATEYCDQNGQNCKTAAEIGSSFWEERTDPTYGFPYITNTTQGGNWFKIFGYAGGQRTVWGTESKPSPITGKNSGGVEIYVPDADLFAQSGQPTPPAFTGGLDANYIVSHGRVLMLGGFEAKTSNNVPLIDPTDGVTPFGYVRIGLGGVAGRQDVRIPFGAACITDAGGCGNESGGSSDIGRGGLFVSKNVRIGGTGTTNGVVTVNGNLTVNGTAWNDTTSLKSGSHEIRVSQEGLPPFYIDGISLIGRTMVYGPTLLFGDTSVQGNLYVSGTKNFVQDHPNDPTKQIAYAALEGPESGTYTRGTAQLSNGEAVITLPDHFSLVTSPTGVTVQVTPLGQTAGLYVAEKSPTRIVVREMTGGSGTVSFDYLVNGVRLGHENDPVIIDKPVGIPSAAEVAEGYQQLEQQRANEVREAGQVVAQEESSDTAPVDDAVQNSGEPAKPGLWQRIVSFFSQLNPKN